MLSQNTKFYIKHFIALVILILFLILILSIYRTGKTTETVNPNSSITPIVETVKNTKTVTPSPETKTQTKNIETVAVSAGDKKIYLQPNITFYDALVKAKNENEITFSGKNYPGLGFFVTEIGTLRAGSGKNLLYYINGKEATVGVSSYTLKDGDVIEWKLE